MEANDTKNKMDELDEQIVELIKQKMNMSREMIEEQKEKQSFDTSESDKQKKLLEIMEQTDENLRNYVYMMYSFIADVSHTYERSLLHPSSALVEKISKAIENTQKEFPSYGIVACQGVEGAFSQHACEKIFEIPNIMYFNHFEGVFSAIDKGLCQYGVLPVENSTAGSVNAIYDLMMKYHFCIVKSIRLKVDHCLLAPKGVDLNNIKEIVTHEQAIGQCSDFIKELGDVKVTPFENTAAAAKYVTQSGRKDIAAIASHDCASLYGLEVIEENIQNSEHNYTRFICISKKLEIYPGADRTSIMMTIGHKPGALYKILSRFYALGINLVKLESRPIPNRDFEFMFYFDIETSVYSQRFTQLICELNEMSEQFSYLGSYLELV
ncbi:MAG: bifunctional chorismate mutase/prephenate dehydratase [Clostridia bacterium]|nr:bifunctional chorismate mutase/prephenate dehydratase [Clostridia bacterium]